MSKPAEYITVTEAAATLRVSRVTIYKWVASGRINAQEIAGRTVIVDNAKYRSEAKA